MNVKPFNLLGRNEHDCLVQHGVRTLESWRDEWLVGELVVSAEIEQTLPPIRADAWSKCFRVGAHALRLTLHGGWEASLSAALLGVSSGDEAEAMEAESLALGTIDRCLRALAASLLPGGSPLLETPPSEFVEEGAVGIRCKFSSGLVLTFVLSAESIEQLLMSKLPVARALGGLTPRKEAIGNETLALHVVLGEAEISLEELRTLAPGDVVRVDRRIGDPLAVQLDNGRTVAGAHLGIKGDHRAIQLINV
jgi:hypothetical protein